VSGDDSQRPILFSEGRVLTRAALRQHAAALARELPAAGYLVNLCEDRGRFIVAYCAAMLRGLTNLLPQSRASEVVDEVIAAHAGCYRCGDLEVQSATRRLASAPRGDDARDAGYVAQISFTSGSTGTPRAHPKRWHNLLRSTQLNAARIRECLANRYADALPWIVATVPPQHMYGTETSVLLPLAAGMAVHAGRPLFPADVALALAEVPEPRVLVTTPVHLRALLASQQRFPEIGAVVSATAPLHRELAVAIEQTLRTTLLEMFGSTETCVIATRLTAHEECWQLYPGVTLEAGLENAQVHAPWFDEPTTLQDVIELQPGGRFLVRGRNADMIEVAGKRASLTELTRRLLSVPGVLDGVVFQPDGPAGAVPFEADGAVRRVAALVVAPGLSVETITRQLAQSVDRAFLPRPLLAVEALPRNPVGKLTRADLNAALRRAGECQPR